MLSDVDVKCLLPPESDFIEFSSVELRRRDLQQLLNEYT